MYADYKRQHSIDVIKQELIPGVNKIKIEPTGDSFKTPARPKRTDKLTGRSSAMASGATATRKSVKVPKESRLGGVKKPKILSEDSSLPKPKLVLDDTPAKSARKNREGQKGAKTKRKAVEADGDYETPGRVPTKKTRMRTRNARKNELNALGNDQDFETDRGLVKG